MVNEEHPYHSILSTIGLGGTQVVFSLFAGQAVIHLKAFGLNPFEIAVTLLFGPLCGAIFPPLFGAWSDQCRSSWGRRRPFIFWGTVVMVLSMLSLAWADSIAKTVVPPTATPTTVRTVLVTLSMILTLAVFVAVQAVQVGLRASITDGSTPMQQSKANTWAGRHITISGFLAYFAAFIGSSQDSTGINSTVFARTSIITAIYLTVTIMITCLCTTDHQAATFETLRVRRVANFRLMQRVLLGSSSQIRTVYLVQFFSWLGWFPLLFYTVPYVNSLDQSHEIANTRSGALAPLSYSAVSLLMAFVWTSQYSNDGSVLNFSNTLSVTDRDIWIGSHCIFGWSMLSTFFVTSAFGTVLLFSAIGISWAVTARVPYSLLGHELSRGSTYLGVEDVSDHQGLIYGVHNLAICLPQILMMAFMGLVWLFTQTNDGTVGVVWFLRLGGLSAFAAAYFATRLDEKPSGIAYNEIEHLEISDSV
ncbi:hypothetical protein E8E14_013375 [Neopestalotiopsis sp. 37M]|nr:hypothetical protein E8E14_013375 [Neopestalotiopsis sp. 37M]